MTELEKQKAAAEFASYWKDRGDEKQETQSFWISLLRKVFDVQEPETYIQFELPVREGNRNGYIDGYIAETRVLIEQKSREANLRNGIRQSDGSTLTPFQQARRYAAYLPHDQHPRWIVVCNFQEFRIHDMNRPNDDPEILKLKDLKKEYYRLQFLVNPKDENTKKEMELSLQAGELVGKIYDAILEKYQNPNDPAVLKSLNKLCVRLVFCLYAEDAGVFGNKRMFHDYLQSHEQEVRRALIDLFHVLDTPLETRDPYMDHDLAAFPYVNGGLFSNSDQDILIPQLDKQIVDLILHRASEDFNWSEISPTIFGAVFESTLNPETRRSGGMHYTSIENIHKVIDPLFLDKLKAELAEIKAIRTDKTRNQKLKRFQKKLAGLKFLDPACGSGNFLTETYLSLRRMENEVLDLLYYNQVLLDMDNPIQVSIGQFYGIEINDFAVTVAKTALWISESQMLRETEKIVQKSLDFLPLKSYANIIEGNALRLDWEEIIPAYKLNYIMGNPPFVGGMYMTEIQKDEIRGLFEDVKGAGEFDYVTGWYQKAVQYTLGTSIQCAFVSTNSICQGSQVITFWKHLIKRYSIHIDFAYTTFVWNSEAKNLAKVHCVIVGFSGINGKNQEKKLFSVGKNYKLCEHISPYLTDTPAIFIESRSNPVCKVPKMRFGSMPRDGGGFVLSPDEKNALITTEPLAEKWIKPYVGAAEFINNKERYCLWLVGADPREINQCSTVKKRVELVREFRLSSKAAGTRKFSATPTLFCQIAQPDSDYIIVPKTSSGKRKYIPLGFMNKDTIASDLVFLIPDATLYHFGILTSNVHMAWMRAVCGRLKSDYRYSKDIVYNNFPWPTPTDVQKAKIEQTAQAILDARALYPDSSLADLYDEITMPPELRRAHQQNDRAVMQAYGLPIKGTTESKCVAELMRMYQKLTES